MDRSSACPKSAFTASAREDGRLRPYVFRRAKSAVTRVIAARTILSAPPHGHTILVQTGSHTIAPFVVTVDYDPLRDFSGVAPLASVPNVLVVVASAGSKTVGDLVATAKTKPGQLNF